MKPLLEIVGGIWAGIGALNVVMMFGNTESSSLESFGLILNIILFIVPGLVLVGIGSIMNTEGVNAALPTMRRGGATGRN